MAGLDRLERLTDLVLVLLGATRPMTLEEIGAAVPGYPEAADARRQAFERDKRLLRDEGIPVRTELIGGPSQYGYRVDPEELYLPDLALDPDEQAALELAVAGVELGDPSGRQALLKLGATGMADTRPLAALLPPDSLASLFAAVRSRSLVSFRYRDEQRQVAPAGLRFGGGRWYLLGWDQGRGAPRTFRVDRIAEAPVVGEPGSGPLPAGFDPDGAAPDEPGRSDDEGAGEVEVWVDPVEANRVVAELGAGSVVRRDPDGSVVVRLGMSAPHLLRSWVFGLLDHAVVVGPPAFRSAIVDWLEPIAAGRPAPEPVQADGHLPAQARSKTPIGSGPALTEADRSRTGRTRDINARLRRLLAIVGWLARAGEAPIDEVAARFGIDPDELVAELELAACCGRPPYSPDELMEIVVTDDTVEAFLPAELARPRRLTPAEGFALATAARTILAVPGADEEGALARALTKLEAVLGSHHLVVDLDTPALLDEVRRATDEGVQIEIEYYSASSDTTTERVVDPWRVVSRESHWYVDGYCHRSAGLRRFRIDRIGRLRSRATPIARRAPTDVVTSDPFVPGPGAVDVRLVLGPEAAWVADTVPVLEVADGGKGRLVATLAVGGRAWLERLLLQAGPQASVLEPDEYRGTAAVAARRLLARYELSQRLGREREREPR